MEAERSTTGPPVQATLAITLMGSSVELGTVPAGVVSRYIDAFRLSLQAVVELSESVTPSESKGRRKRWIERMAGLRLVGIEAGSVRILFAEPPWTGLFAESDQAAFARALTLYFGALEWVVSTDAKPSQDALPMLSSAQIQRLLDIVSRLSPPRRGPVKQIMVERRVDQCDTNVWTSVTLDRHARARIQSELEQLSSVPRTPL